MADRFYPGQKDYIYQLNLMSTDFANATGATTTIGNDNTLASTVYPVWATGAGEIPLRISTTKISFNPSTGVLSTTAESVSTTLTTNAGGTVAAGVASIKAYGPSSNNAWGGKIDFLSFDGTTVNASVYASSVALFFAIAGSARWQITPTGHFQAVTDNSYDIGASGATRPRNVYVGTSVFAGGNITVSGSTSVIGYATGSAGTVTQATSKTTGVTLNKANGTITMAAGSIAANSVVSFTFTNSTIAASDLVVVVHASTGTGGAYNATAFAGAGTATVYVRNLTAGALDEQIVLRFAVIKGATS